MFRRSWLVALAAATVFSGGASAAPVYFLLGDHPSSEVSPQNGLLLSYGPIDLPGLGPERTVFSVGDNLGLGGGPLYLTWDEDDPTAGASMFGRIFNPWDNSFWEVQYEFFGTSADPAGGIRATGGNGTLTRGDDEILLRSKQRESDGLAFFFNNAGYQLPGDTGWAGTGWVEFWYPSKVRPGEGSYVSIGFSDWGLTGERLPGPPPGEEIPEPATVTLMLTGLGALVLRRRFTGKA